MAVSLSSLSQTQVLFCSAGKSKPNLSVQNAARCRSRTKLSFSPVVQASSSLNFPGGKSSFSYNPLGFSVKESKKNGRGSGAVCSAALLTVRNVQWVAAIANVILMVVRGTAIHKSFLVPLFALQAPESIISWIKGEYGLWTAILALLVRLFFGIPGDLELPFLALLLVIVAPYQVMELRTTQQGAIISIVIAAYLAYQHFTRAGGLQNSFEIGSIIPTIAIICVAAVSCFLLA